MRIIVDLHIHSRFARGCSPELTVENLASPQSVYGGNHGFTFQMPSELCGSHTVWVHSSSGNGLGYALARSGESFTFNNPCDSGE